MRDGVLEQWWRDVISANWPADQCGPNLVDVIARSCGWKPLVVGETMTVRMGGKTYEITRKADDQ